MPVSYIIACLHKKLLGPSGVACCLEMYEHGTGIICQDEAKVKQLGKEHTYLASGISQTTFFPDTSKTVGTL